MTPLMTFAKAGNSRNVQAISKVSGVDVNAQDVNGKTALMLALGASSDSTYAISSALLRHPSIDATLLDNVSFSGRIGLHKRIVVCI